MPRIKPERKVARRAEIVAAARACFARNGFHKTTLQDVFAQSGLSAGCVYNYFQSKDELMLAVAAARHDIESRTIAETLATADPVAGLMAVAEAFVTEYLGASEEPRRIALDTWSESLRNPAILNSVQQGLHCPRKQLVDLIERGKARARLSAHVDADMTARTMIALLHGFILQKLWDPELCAAAVLGTFRRLLPSLLEMSPPE
jgi:AcrR family transcriptional regulator